MKPPCDLHLHSCYSDGKLSPRILVRRARDAGLSAVSITDHDSIEGQEEALWAGGVYGIEVLSGVEFSARQDSFQIHIIGYCFDLGHKGLKERLHFLAEARVTRAKSIVDRLVDQGIRVSFDEVLAEGCRGTIGRPHIARILLRNGVIGEIQEAFDRFIGRGRPAYVAKTVLPLEEIFHLIADAGGVAVWAHPGPAIRRRAILDRLCGLGVRGLEVWHPNHTPSIERDIENASLKRGLICTGGSDYHFRDAMKADVGEVTAPYESAAALRKAACAMRDT